jgi:hypothetical protein
MKYLATIDETVEIEMLRELLETNNILLMTKHRETGEFLEIYAGMTIFGADLYVAEPQYDAAFELYQAFFTGKTPIDEEALAEEALNAENPEELAYDESNEVEEDEDEDETL